MVDGIYHKRSFLYYISVIGVCIAVFFVLNSFLSLEYAIVFSVGLGVILIIPLRGGSTRALLIIALVGAIIYFGYFTGETGVAKRGWISLGDLSLSAIKAKINEWSNLAKAKLYGYGEWKNPQVVEKKKPVGVKIKDIISKGFFISDKDEVEIRANIKVYGLKSISPKIKFGCEIENFDGNMIEAESVEVFGEETNEVFVPRGQDKIYTIKCNFGVMESVKKNDIRKVKVKAIYSDFVTRANIIVYTLKGEVIKQIGEVDPFKYFRINDRRNIDREGIAIPHKEVNAPVELWLNIPTQQPFIEDVDYFVGMRLYNDNLWWGGKLRKLKYLSLIYPETIVRGESCDLDEDLVLVEEDFSKINKKLEEDEFEVNDINNLKYFCDFSVVTAGDVPEASMIRAQLIYDYEFSKSSSITLVEEEEYKGV